MKNIHVLPTDKPSRVRIGNNGNFVIGLAQNATVSKNDSYTNQNIYITSDEEIKDADWCFHSNQESIIKIGVGEGKLMKDHLYLKKIILTTDQDLIKDGVQAIDDEFLEWFVKNPSCESVGVTFGCLEVRQCMCDSNARCLKPGYEIIIPKEEPKQDMKQTAVEWLVSELKKYDSAGLKDQSNYVIEMPTHILTELEEQAKQMEEQQGYSEEEVYKLTLEALDLGMRIRQDQLSGYSEKSGKELHKEWFEQFKNK